MSWFTSSASSIIRGMHRRERKLSLWLRRHEDDETCNLKWFKDKNPFTQSLLHASIRTNILWITSALSQTFSRFKCVDFCSSQLFFRNKKILTSRLIFHVSHLLFFELPVTHVFDYDALSSDSATFCLIYILIWN